MRRTRARLGALNTAGNPHSYSDLVGRPSVRRTACHDSVIDGVILHFASRNPALAEGKENSMRKLVAVLAFVALTALAPTRARRRREAIFRQQSQPVAIAAAGNILRRLKPKARRDLTTR
jgi:hypothetical protein